MYTSLGLDEWQAKTEISLSGLILHPFGFLLCLISCPTPAQFQHESL